MKYFEDAEVGDTFHSPEPYLVTAEEIKSFATQWDPQRYHLDDAEAAKVVGALFAPALLSMCISFKLTHASGYFDILPAAGLGMEEVTLAKPVFANDRLSAVATVMAKRESNSKPDLGLMTHKTELFNQDGELVLSYQIPSLVYRRSSAEA
jgi:acyl dehydratase